MSVLYDLRLRVYPLPGKARALMPIPTPFWSQTGDAARAALTALVLRRGVCPTPYADPPFHTTRLLAFILLSHDG